MGSDFRGKKPLARKARENLSGFDEAAPYSSLAGNFFGRRAQSRMNDTAHNKPNVLAIRVQEKTPPH